MYIGVLGTIFNEYYIGQGESGIPAICLLTVFRAAPVFSGAYNQLQISILERITI